MNRSSKRAIWLFYAIAFLEALYFYAPVASLYRMEFGVTLFQITLIESAFFAVALLLEMPWGFFTARFGYKNTLLATGALNVLAATLFWRANGFGMFLAQRCVLAAAVSGFSGCDAAYLSRLAEPGEYHKALGRYNAAPFMAVAATGAGFSLILPLGYRMLALLTLLCVSVGFILRLWLPQVEAEPQDMLPLRQQLRALGQVLGQNRPFLLFVICGAVLYEVENTLTVFFSSPAYQGAGIAQSWYGVLNLSLNLVGMAGSLLSVRLAEKGAGRAVAACWLMALVSGAMLCFTQSALALIVLLPLLRLAAQGYRPCELVLKNQRTGGASRAVVLSAYSMAGSIVGITLWPLLGAGTGAALRYGFYTGFSLVLLAALITLTVWRRIVLSRSM